MFIKVNVCKRSLYHLQLVGKEQSCLWRFLSQCCLFSLQLAASAKQYLSRSAFKHHQIIRSSSLILTSSSSACNMIIDNFSINYVSICYCYKQTLTSMTPYDRGKTHNIIFVLSLILTSAINFPSLHKPIKMQQST